MYTFKHALIQDAAYQSLLRSTRQQYHQRITQVLEAQFPATAEAAPELLAQHYTEAGLREQAIPYWQRAGQRSIERSANLEAISHFTRGLEVLHTLPDTTERAQQELLMQTVLASTYIAVKGMGAREVEQAYTRAQALCQQVGELPQLIPVLQGLRRLYTARAEYQRVREIGEQLLDLAERLHDPVALVEGHLAMGILLRDVGALPEARTHLEQGIAFYNPQQHRSLTFRHGRDPGIIIRYVVAFVLWLLGYPSQALQRSQEAITLAQELAQAYGLTQALYRREGPAAQVRAEATIALATEHGFAQSLACGTIVCGWARVEQGQREPGITQMRQGLTALQATGTEAYLYLALLADAQGKGGQAEEGLTLLTEALTALGKAGAHGYEAELYRLKGELLLRLAVPDAPQAEACFQQALAIARRQQAKSWELRAAMSLSRLWQQQGKHTEARALLAPIYDWFTEGFDTADLQEAKALLEALT
jgi:predicted ATPase